MFAEHTGIVLDYSRQRVTVDTMSKLHALARAAGVESKIAAMFKGEHLNVTEDRAVAHAALRSPKGTTFTVDGKDVVPDVNAVLDRVEAFSDAVRTGKRTGVTGKPLTDVVSIGIGGSYLGPEFVFEALRHEGDAASAAEGRRLRFLANVDPVDVARALEGLDPESTLVSSPHHSSLPPARSRLPALSPALAPPLAPHHHPHPAPTHAHPVAGCRGLQDLHNG